MTPHERGNLRSAEQVKGRVAIAILVLTEQLRFFQRKERREGGEEEERGERRKSRGEGRRKMREFLSNSHSPFNKLKAADCGAHNQMDWFSLFRGPMVFREKDPAAL